MSNIVEITTFFSWLGNTSASNSLLENTPNYAFFGGNGSNDLSEEVAVKSQTGFLGIVSDEALRTVAKVVNGCMLPVIVLFGVSMNTVNMAVFYRQGLRDRINLCLFSLALSDSGFNLFHFASRIFGVFYFFDVRLAEYWNVRSLIFIGVYLGFLNTSNSLVLVLSLERCICVISPLRAKRLLSARQMLAIIVTLYTLCLLGTGLGSFMFKVGEYHDPVTNATRYYTALTDFYVNYRPVIVAIFEITFNATVPITSLFIVMTATVIIAVRMRSVMAWRKETAHPGANQGNQTSRSEASVTRMLQVVAIVYTCCTAPTVAMALARSFVPDFISGRRYNNIFFVTIFITHMLEAVNCSVNFIIYYTMSTKYRETFHEMFGIKQNGDKKDDDTKTKVSVLSSEDSGFSAGNA